MSSYSRPVSDGPSTGGWRAATASLRHQQFRWVYGSNIAFFFAMNGQFVVRSYLAFKLTDSAFALGLVNLAFAVPMLIISPFGGVVADRVNRKRLILTGQAVLIAAELFIFSLLVTNQLEFWHLAITVFLMGCIFPFIMPARQAIVVNIVGREGLPNAMALQMSGINACRIVAPVMAGFLIYLVSPKGAYGVSVVLFIIAFVAMTHVHAPAPGEPSKKSVFGDLVDGFRYVRDDHAVRALIGLSIVPIMLALPFQTLLVVFAEDVWDVGARGLGVLQAVAGFGGILGSIWVAWHGTTRRYVGVMMSSLLAFAGTLFLFAISPWFFLALPLVLIADLFASVFTTVNSTCIQLIIPDEVRGRVLSLMMMTFGLTPLGTVPISAAAEAWGAPVAVGGATVLCMAVAVAFYFFSPALRSIDAVSQAREASGIATRPTSGSRPTPQQPAAAAQ